jgi:hypothetical protein
LSAIITAKEDEICHAREAIAFPIAVEEQEAESSNPDEGADRSQHQDLLANKWQRWQFDVLVNRFYMAQVFERSEVMLIFPGNIRKGVGKRDRGCDPEPLAGKRSALQSR